MMGRKQQAKRLSKQPTQPGSPALSAAAIQPRRNARQSERDAVSWILGMPRLVRIILIAIPALATTIIFVPVIDSIYLRYFFSMETRVAPSIIEALIAVLVYIIGWVLVVGTAGEKPEERRAVRWYMNASLVLMALASIYLAVLLLNARE